MFETDCQRLVYEETTGEDLHPVEWSAACAVDSKRFKKKAWPIATVPCPREAAKTNGIHVFRFSLYVSLGHVDRALWGQAAGFPRLISTVMPWPWCLELVQHDLLFLDPAPSAPRCGLNARPFP